jgi:hypothetical protein
MDLALLLTAVLSMAVAGGIVFYAMVIVAAFGFRRERASAASRGALPIPISVLKPLSGLDPELEANLRTFFRLEYPQFELLFAAREESDPALAVVRRLQAEFPGVPSQLIVTGKPPSPEFPNAKVYSLSRMARAAKTLNGGCPMTGHLVWEQIRRAKRLSLAEVFRMEYALSLNCCRHPEFPEGVRARLIDKDQTPRWHWPDVAAIADEVIEAHFEVVWEGEHPLADL